MSTYIKAKDVIRPMGCVTPPEVTVSGEMPLVDLLSRLLDVPGREVGVVTDNELIGVVTESSLLEGLGRMIAPRDDSSVVGVICDPEDYSASRLAHAVEDAGAHLVDLFSAPSADGRVLVTLRVRTHDPSSTIHHLERYGYEVAEAQGGRFLDAETAAERLQLLGLLMNV